MVSKRELKKIASNFRDNIQLLQKQSKKVKIIFRVRKSGSEERFEEVVENFFACLCDGSVRLQASYKVLCA